MARRGILYQISLEGAERARHELEQFNQTLRKGGQVDFDEYRRAQREVIITARALNNEQRISHQLWLAMHPRIRQTSEALSVFSRVTGTAMNVMNTINLAQVMLNTNTLRQTQLVTDLAQAQREYNIALSNNESPAVLAELRDRLTLAKVALEEFNKETESQKLMGYFTFATSIAHLASNMGSLVTRTPEIVNALRKIGSVFGFGGASTSVVPRGGEGGVPAGSGGFRPPPSTGTGATPTSVVSPTAGGCLEICNRSQAGIGGAAGQAAAKGISESLKNPVTVGLITAAVTGAGIYVGTQLTGLRSSLEERLEDVRKAMLSSPVRTSGIEGSGTFSRGDMVNVVNPESSPVNVKEVNPLKITIPKFPDLLFPSFFDVHVENESLDVKVDNWEDMPPPASNAKMEALLLLMRNDASVYAQVEAGNLQIIQEILNNASTEMTAQEIVAQLERMNIRLDQPLEVVITLAKMALEEADTNNSRADMFNQLINQRQATSEFLRYGPGGFSSGDAAQDQTIMSSLEFTAIAAAILASLGIGAAGPGLAGASAARGAGSIPNVGAGSLAEKVLASGGSLLSKSGGFPDLKMLALLLGGAGTGTSLLFNGQGASAEVSLTGETLASMENAQRAVMSPLNEQTRSIEYSISSMFQGLVSVLSWQTGRQTENAAMLSNTMKDNESKILSMVDSVAVRIAGTVDNAATRIVSTVDSVATRIISAIDRIKINIVNNYYSGGGGNSDSSRVVDLTPKRTSTPVKAMAEGGIINEPIYGIGKSGMSYLIGERGPEMVIPMDAIVRGSNAGGGNQQVIINIDVTVQGSVMAERELNKSIEAYLYQSLRQRGIGTR